MARRDPLGLGDGLSWNDDGHEVPKRKRNSRQSSFGGYDDELMDDLEEQEQEFKKERKRLIFSQSRERGRMAEHYVREGYEWQGYEMERRPHGQDFVARRRNPWTGQVRQTKYIEVKTGDARLSELQQKTKKVKKRNYIIERIRSWF